MNPDNEKHRLQHRSEEETVARTEQTAKQTSETEQTFASVDDLLRFDAAQTTPPPAIVDRLEASIQQEPKRSWWQRFLGRE